LGEALVEGPALVEDPVWIEGAALQEALQLLQPAAQVDCGRSADILVLFVAVWRWDGGLGGELAVIGNVRSIASLGVFGRGLGRLVLFLR